MALSDRERKKLELENEQLSAMGDDELDRELERLEQERRREAARSLIRKR